MKIFIDIAGWFGAITVLVAYYLVSTKKTKSNSKLYQGLNLVGAAALVLNTFWYGAVPSASLNLVWGLIALISLWKVR